MAKIVAERRPRAGVVHRIIRVCALAPLLMLSLPESLMAETSQSALRISEEEFQSYFGVQSLSPSYSFQSSNKPKLVDRSVATLELASAATEPNEPASIEPVPLPEPLDPNLGLKREVLPASFAKVLGESVPSPHVLLANDKSLPKISPLDCAVREHSKHNLAFRCNAPVALNVPGGDNPSKSFLKEMERETRLDVGTDIWPGDKDALTGDRLLSARDAVTGVRFTLRYLDQRGFTLGSSPCSNRSKWRWSYICVDDAKWNALSRMQQCTYVLDNLLSVEGGSAKWYFAPMAGPKAVPQDQISVGFTKHPAKIQDAKSLCTELAAQERIDRMTASLKQSTPLKVEILAVSSQRKQAVTLTARVGGKSQRVARFGLRKDQSIAAAVKELGPLWRSIGGERVCAERSCRETVEMALPPLPLYRPSTPALPSLDLREEVSIDDLAMVLQPLGQ